MPIDKVKITNFKKISETLTVTLNPGTNLLVGDNEAGKSTILEAINLALTGIFNGRYVRYEMSQYLFNRTTVNSYLDSISTDSPKSPPFIEIEIFFINAPELSTLEGNGNSEKTGHCGVLFKIEFDTSYNEEYSALVNGADVKTLPIEYYRVVWRSFARKDITARSVPLKVAYIDSSHSKSQNGSDIYISRIVKNLLSSEEIAKVSQSHRKMKESFMADESIEAINKKISKAANISNKEVKISVELSSGNAWENSLTTYLDGVPFKYIGKGEQNIVKTNLALAQIQPKQTQLVLLEEPENHLSHTKLHQFLSFIKDACIEKQILITTHSSFVSNKLGLKDLILLDNLRTTRLTSLGKDTQTFFEKISGYDTLRLILCEKAILVEGASDELVVQKAYQSLHNGRLPIEDRVEVISVGLSFLRFLEIAQTLQTKICVVTDNDGDVSALNKKYSNYLGENTKPNINICFDEAVDNGELNVGIKGFNYNTLEPKLLKGNSLSILNSVFEKQFSNEGELLIYMNRHKTDCALKVFESNESLNFPQYILDAVS